MILKLHWVVFHHILGQRLSKSYEDESTPVRQLEALPINFQSASTNAKKNIDRK